MKKFLVFYVVFSIILLVLVYLVTLIQETQKRSIELFYEKAESAVTDLNFDDFIKYQSVHYKMLHVDERPSYTVFFYHVIGQSQQQISNEFVVIVLPTQPVNYAKQNKDLNDQTGIILVNETSEDVIFNTYEDQTYSAFALSYGIHQFGFYYYTIGFETHEVFNLQLFDYQKQSILQMDFEVSILESSEEADSKSFLKAYTQNEIEQMLNMQKHLVQPMMINIALFLAIDIIVGVLLYYFIKKKSDV